ncbi:MAG: minichromosome maintenance protein MCM, partial [Thermoplasmata archaeon]|nr:minichromosome maintenance protein MCM [Thermoplasmata archaeon]
SQKYKLLQFLNTIARAVHISESDSFAGTKQEFDKLLGGFVNRVLESKDYLNVIAAVINQKYPGLAGDFRSAPSAEELSEMESEEYNNELMKIENSVESNIEIYAPLLAKIKRAKKTDFEKIALDLDRIVIFGPRNWELMLYSIMSPHAARMLINNLDYRANIHSMLAGDISTAKSKILKVCKLISPKMLVVDVTTKATFEGVAPTRSGDDIEDGILDLAMDGNMIVEEYTNTFARMPLMRRAMDGEYIEIWKKGSSKGIHPNTTIIAACNPEGDFFIEETKGNFRQQIAFKEGILSRFDNLVLLTATQVKNELIIDKMHLMSTQSPLHKIDFMAIKEDLETLAEGMKSGAITRVTMTPSQQKKVKEAFLNQNERDKQKRLLNNRPLVILRDLENLSRLVNIIATVNFSKRTIKNGLLKASNEDIDKAILLWENMINLRVEIYGMQGSRNFMSVQDEMVAYTMRVQEYNKNQGGEPTVTVAELRAEIVDRRRLIGRTTFYEELRMLRESGHIVQHGKRDGTLAVVIK